MQVTYWCFVPSCVGNIWIVAESKLRHQTLCWALLLYFVFSPADQCGGCDPQCMMTMEAVDVKMPLLQMLHGACFLMFWATWLGWQLCNCLSFGACYNQSHWWHRCFMALHNILCQAELAQSDSVADFSLHSAVGIVSLPAHRDSGTFLKKASDYAWYLVLHMVESSYSSRTSTLWTSAQLLFCTCCQPQAYHVVSVVVVSDIFIAAGHCGPWQHDCVFSLFRLEGGVVIAPFRFSSFPCQGHCFRSFFFCAPFLLGRIWACWNQLDDHYIFCFGIYAAGRIDRSQKFVA